MLETAYVPKLDFQNTQSLVYYIMEKLRLQTELQT